MQRKLNKQQEGRCAMRAALFHKRKGEKEMKIETGSENRFLLHTKDSTYGFCVDKEGMLRTLYWGGRLNRLEDLKNEAVNWEQGFHPLNDIKREECSSFGTMRFKETSLKVRYADGTRDFRYRYSGYEQNEDSLTVRLRDEVYPLEVDLHYKVYEEENIIEKWRTIRNCGQEEIVLERIHSGECSLPGGGWRIKNFNGMWNSDFDEYEQELKGGKHVIESLRGATGHVGNPSFVVHKDAGETYGEVYYGVLGWSGNFKLVLEQTPYEFLNILMGVSDTDFEWVLKGGQKLDTPSMYIGYSPYGFDYMSNMMAQFARTAIMPKTREKREQLVLYNSWEATYFDVGEAAQSALVEKAAELGVELFVMDDGWFGQRKNDHAGLGDWYVNREKFPNGLKPLIEKVKQHGMQFGLWIEPEMVNRDSNLYRQHPDWVYHYATRSIQEGRYQYMLDLTRTDVQEYILEQIDRLLNENDIAYIKWDMNRGMSEAASEQLKPLEYKSIWYRHVMAFYSLIRELRTRHPEVEWEACASGGGRVDYGTMRYFDEYWPSDNTDPLDRLSIQEGYSYLYPIKYMRSWVTNSGENGKRSVPLEFRLHCAMCGALGIGVDLNKCTDQDMVKMKGAVTAYKELRGLIQFGRLHRLASLKSDGLQAVQYENGNESVIFAFLDHPNRWKTKFTVRLRGLQENVVYCVEHHGTRNMYSGAFLMRGGLQLALDHDYASCMIRVFAVEKLPDVQPV